MMDRDNNLTEDLTIEDDELDNEPTYLCYTFRCTLCEQSSDWKDGYPRTADEVRLVWVELNGEVRTRTMYEKDHCFICKECMGKIKDGQITFTDARGARGVANLVMY